MVARSFAECPVAMEFAEILMIMMPEVFAEKRPSFGPACDQTSARRKGLIDFFEGVTCFQLELADLGDSPMPFAELSLRSSAIWLSKSTT